MEHTMSPNLGYKHSPEAIEKIRAAAKKRRGETSGYFGKKHSYESKEKIRRAKLREKHPHWKGGRKITKAGYVYILKPDHPFANSDGRVLEHRLVMEETLARYLDPSEVVHHINGNTSDNRRANLELFENIGSHTSYHNHAFKK